MSRSFRSERTCVAEVTLEELRRPESQKARQQWQQIPIGLQGQAPYVCNWHAPNAYWRNVPRNSTNGLSRAETLRQAETSHPLWDIYIQKIGTASLQWFATKKARFDVSITEPSVTHQKPCAALFHCTCDWRQEAVLGPFGAEDRFSVPRLGRPFCHKYSSASVPKYRSPKFPMPGSM